MCFKKPNTFRKKTNVKVEKKHYKIYFCFYKANVLLLIITLIYDIEVSTELAWYMILKSVLNLPDEIS